MEDNVWFKEAAATDQARQRSCVNVRQVFRALCVKQSTRVRQIHAKTEDNVFLNQLAVVVGMAAAVDMVARRTVALAHRAFRDKIVNNKTRALPIRK